MLVKKVTRKYFCGNYLQVYSHGIEIEWATYFLTKCISHLKGQDIWHLNGVLKVRLLLIEIDMEFETYLWSNAAWKYFQQVI